MIKGKKYNELISALGLNIYQMEKALGLSQSRLSKAIDRNSEIKLDIVEKTCLLFPKVNRDWLMTEEGDMFNKEKPNTDYAFEPESPYNNSNYRDKYEKMLEENYQLQKEIIKLLKDKK